MGSPPGTVYRIVQWAEERGEVRTMSRIRLKTLGVTVAEGFTFTGLTEQTPASERVVEAVRRAASDVVGARCPH